MKNENHQKWCKNQSLKRWIWAWNHDRVIFIWSWCKMKICQNVQSSNTVHNACIYGHFEVVFGTWCATHKCSGNLQPLTFWKLFHFFPLGVPEGTIFAIIYCAFVSIIRALCLPFQFAILYRLQKVSFLANFQ